jgi:hypothetical protein
MRDPRISGGADETRSRRTLFRGAGAIFVSVRRHAPSYRSDPMRTTRSVLPAQHTRCSTTSATTVAPNFPNDDTYKEAPWQQRIISRNDSGSVSS